MELKELYLAKSIKELNAKAAVDGKIYKTGDLMLSKINKCYNAGRLRQDSGDEEAAYVLFMRTCDLANYFKKVRDYPQMVKRNDPSIREAHSVFKSSLDKMDSLQSSLKRRYELSELAAAAANNSTINTTAGLPSPSNIPNKHPKHTVASSHSSVIIGSSGEHPILKPINNNDLLSATNQQTAASSISISPIELFQAVKLGESILMLDLRDDFDKEWIIEFNGSGFSQCYDHVSVASIPSNIVTPGVIPSLIEKSLPVGKDKIQFKKRLTFHRIVLFDKSSHSSVISDSRDQRMNRVNIMYKSLTVYDTFQSRTRPSHYQVLAGGFDSFYISYQMYCVRSAASILVSGSPDLPVGISSYANQWIQNLAEVEYPKFMEDFFEASFLAVTTEDGIVETESSTQPAGSLYEGDEDGTTNVIRRIPHRPPIIDRRSKPVSYAGGGNDPDEGIIQSVHRNERRLAESLDKVIEDHIVTSEKVNRAGQLLDQVKFNANGETTPPKSSPKSSSEDCIRLQRHQQQQQQQQYHRPTARSGAGGSASGGGDDFVGDFFRPGEVNGGESHNNSSSHLERHLPPNQQQPQRPMIDRNLQPKTPSSSTGDFNAERRHGGNASTNICGNDNNHSGADKKVSSSSFSMSSSSTSTATPAFAATAAANGGAIPIDSERDINPAALSTAKPSSQRQQQPSSSSSNHGIVGMNAGGRDGVNGIVPTIDRNLKPTSSSSQNNNYYRDVPASAPHSINKQSNGNHNQRRESAGSDPRLSNGSMPMPPAINRQKKPNDEANRAELEQLMRLHKAELYNVYKRLQHANRTEIGNVSFGLSGLENLGNTCYMNSVLQCLLHTRPLRDMLLQQRFIPFINTNNPKSPRSCGRFPSQLSALFFADWVGGEHGKGFRSIDPSALRESIISATGSFNDSRQHDAAECLTIILDVLLEDLNLISRPPPSPEQARDVINPNLPRLAYQAELDESRRCKSIVNDIFQGQEVSTVECTACHLVSPRFTPFNQLNLEIPSGIRNMELDHCLEEYFCEEIISGEWKCPNCKQIRNATKTMSIWKLPQILIINFKRFWTTEEKIQTFINFPINNLNLHDFIHPQSPEYQLNLQYRLYGITNHSGTLERGHYTAFCRQQETEGSQYYYFDDESVRPVNQLDDIKSKRAYILFYERIG